MQRRTPRPLGLALALAVAMSGCQSTRISASAPTHTSAPNVSVASTPASTPSEAMAAGFKVSDVQEAERVYRKFITTYWLLSANGSSPNESEALLTLTDPPFKPSVEAALKFQREEGIIVTQGQGSVIFVRPAIAKEVLDSIVALDVCTDERKLLLRRADGRTKWGLVHREIAYFHRSPEGSLKYFANQIREDTAECLN